MSTGIASLKKYQFIMENLNCAHCASVIEDTVKKQEELAYVQFSFPTKKMVVTPTEEYASKFPSVAGMQQALQSKLQQISDSIEDGVVVASGEAKQETAQSHHHHGAGTMLAYIEVVIGFILLLILGLTDLVPSPYDQYAVLTVYIVMARHILVTGIQNAKKGRFMDENLLMGIATLGAFVLGDFREGLGVILFYRVGIIFEEKATERSREEIMSVVDMRPEVVTVVTEQGKEEIPAAAARVGQIVQVRAGDRIPLDGTIIRGESRVDTSPVTGEPKPIAVAAGSEVLSGCINLSGTVQIRIEKALEESFVSKMLEAVETASANKPTVDRFITRFARYYTPIVLAITVLTVLIPSLVTGDWVTWIYTGLTFLVISCPCALVLSVPLAFFAGIGGGSKLGILFKGGLSMEHMAKIKAIAMDKTGTITKGTFSVAAIDVYEPADTAPTWSAQQLLALCASSEASSTHPIALSLREKATEEGLTWEEPTSVQEFAGEGIQAEVQGHTVLCGNSRLLARFGVVVPEDWRQMVTEQAVAGATEVWMAIDGVFAGRILIRDQVKADAVSSIAALQKAGYTVAMVTGDAKDSAREIAEEAGISHVYSNLLPTDKWAVLKEMRTVYGPVMFVGDGINDAPVLAGADVGCAMGSGADAALEAADVVFMNSEVGAVDRALQLAKKTIAVAWQNVIFAIGVKVLVMLLGFFGYASMWLAIFADTGVMILCVLNAVRLLYPNMMLGIGEK